MEALATEVEVHAPYYDYVVDTFDSIQVQIPGYPLAPQSLQVGTYRNKSYTQWTAGDHANTFDALKKIVSFWEQKRIATQYLIGGKVERGEHSFKWEAMPFYKTSSSIGRLWQQFLVLWKITFGGTKLSPTELQKQQDIYSNFRVLTPSSLKIEEPSKGSDAFCQERVIQKQKVLQGRNVEILFNYAPLGAEKLHFLIVPKQHRATFGELTSEEYQEAMEWSQKLISHFFDSRVVQNVYLFHKTGIDAGQTVPHWHLHVVFTSNKAQDFMGRLAVLKNMVWGSSGMKEEALSKHVAALHSELICLQ